MYQKLISVIHSNSNLDANLNEEGCSCSKTNFTIYLFTFFKNCFCNRNNTDILLFFRTIEGRFNLVTIDFHVVNAVFFF